MADDKARPTLRCQAGQDLDDHHVSSSIEAYDRAAAEDGGQS